MRVRLRHMGCAALATGLALTLGACSEQSLNPGSRGPVTVDVRCNPKWTFVNVKPWLVQVRRDSSTSWRLAGTATVDSLTLRPKQGHWPFAGNPRHVGKGQPAASGPANGPPGPYQYTIVAFCGTQDSVVIDPDMEIL